MALGIDSEAPNRLQKSPTVIDIESPLPSYNDAKALRRLLDSWMERLQLISVLVSDGQRF